MMKLIDEGNLSDLRPEEIPDDHVSGVEDNLETLEGDTATADSGVMDAQA